MAWPNNKELIGKIFPSNNFGDFKIVDYIDNRNVIIEFLNTGTVTTVRLQNLQKGRVKDYMLPIVHGVGYMGSPEFDKSGQVSRWQSLIQRCYSVKSFEVRPTYEDKIVCEDWKNFSLFREWVIQQAGFNLKGWELDKDLLIKDNKIYSPDTCVFLPHEINIMLVRHRSVRGDLPIGVRLKFGWYESRCGGMHLGKFKTPEEAFFCYKTKKEELLRESAEEYRNLLDPRAYNALLNYKVEITD